MSATVATKLTSEPPNFEELESAVVRFAGDSGDGMQMTGAQFTTSTALAGADLATFPDFPAEIRAPAGTTFGVSAFQINFGSGTVLTAGDEPDVLVTMNPAALKMNIGELREGGMVVIDTGAFTPRNLQKAGFETNPLEDDTLARFQAIELDISAMTLEAVKSFGLSNKDALRCKNMWTLGLMLWMFGRKRQTVIEWLTTKFEKHPELAAANIAALNAGHAFGETAEMSTGLKSYHIAPAKTEPGLYSTVTGSQAMSWGLVAGAQLADLTIMLGSYPITPASPILHQLSAMKEFGVITFQAEDEIAAICSAIGASFAGLLGITSSSGPGIALKTEAMGLAISTELPLIIVNSQRGGPSTGLPTKTEQSDLYQAIYGRNGDAPLPVLSAASPGDCFETAIEAIRIATKYMTPVMLLTDGYIANAAEPWKIPDMADFKPFPVQHAVAPEDGSEGKPFERNMDTLARVWVKPGTPGLEHRIGGLERDFETGHISYDPENHQKMTDLRHSKIAGIARDIPAQEVTLGEDSGDVAVVGWGSTYGPIDLAVRRARADGIRVSHIHIRHLNPFPTNLESLLAGFDQILIPEMNMGQLYTVLKDRFQLKATAMNKVSGQPFKISEIHQAINELVGKA
ncbi:MAG: 2-oxoacid:acceptor oxidoreductase subunit alpha [Proteobacteria bacterium]|nr:2-oxoacid:acceptor oxidoreductase subunit alpha [Pseudomonadota bacterium]